mmetsp:Transcript_21347/g.49041  ORF Transcript_21347/g.49041 Transcript_21347/m.49041 type:complete len:225 (-) Transcript_21347:23-697(-)
MATSMPEDERPILEARIRELEEEVAEHQAQQLRLRELLQDSLRREAKAHQSLEQTQRSSSAAKHPNLVTHTFEVESDSEEAVEEDEAASRELESAYESLGTGDRATELRAQSLKTARPGTEMYTPRTVNFWDDKVRTLEMLAQQIQQSQVSTAPSSESTGSESALDTAASGDDEANESSPSSTPLARRRYDSLVSPMRPKAQDLLTVHGGLFSCCRLVGQRGAV